MMFNRILKRFYIFFMIIVGVSFWALVRNTGFLDISVTDIRSRNSRNDIKQIASHLNVLEGEIASQHIISNSLLSKLKEKYRSNSMIAESLRDSSKSINLPNNRNSIGAKDSKTSDSDKLSALQQELQIEAHHGEIRSDGEDHQAHSNDKNVENKEVEDNSIVHHPLKNETVIGVLVFVCNRPTVKRCLDRLFKYRPSATTFPIIVSQDCGSHPATTQVLNDYGNAFTHIMQPDLSEIDVPPKEKKLKGYFNIARHYGFALNYTFNILNFTNVIVVEDDLEISPDFFEYFSGTLNIMQKDPSIWCASAWNDNGKSKRINETAFDLLHRTDFFPGLGWMLTKEIWKELMVKWPRSYWDDWMREPGQRKDRACIRPEISRTTTFGKYGVSQGTYYQNHLRFIKLNDHFVPFSNLNLNYLLKDIYDVDFVRRVYSSQVVSSVDELVKLSSNSNVNELRLTYRTKQDFRMFAKRLELMEDFRAGVPRTAYRGVVPFMYNNRRVYLAPGANWESYRPYFR